MAEKKIVTRHPKGKTGRSIDRAKYDPMKRAILAAVRRGELTHAELMKAIREKLEGRFDGNISWYAETVKLDLEARKEIQRTGTRPERYAVTKAR
jgi:hypothetical protein